MDIDRRQILLGASAATLLHPAIAIAKAMAIDADVRAGTIADVQHVVILMQENRAFDHYFGAMNGVRGFADRFPIPLPDRGAPVGRTVWTQANDTARGGPPLIAPFALNTQQDFRHMRVEGTPHNWADAQAAWDEGRMDRWPAAKGEHAMGYFRREDIPFQYALADAFTLCDAYHCSIQTGTNTNRLFLWSGTNDPFGRHGGPSISNSHDRFVDVGGHPDSYTWTTYPERLLAAGITWRVYQNQDDNFTDNPTEGFKTYRDSANRLPGSDARLYELSFKTRLVGDLKADVVSGALPQVSYIVAPAADSEHPGPSSPAQGADYVARVIEALTADPAVWAKTVLLVMYDENDGFFDHVPPPAPPSLKDDGTVQGGSTVDTAGEYHTVAAASEALAERPAYMGRPYGLGPRVPLFVISPWSRGGWVSSEVFDHTSVIRFLETRFGVMEPNISPWRRTVCGDLTSAFDFRTPNAPFPAGLPDTRGAASRAAALTSRTRPATPATPQAPEQEAAPRLSRALPYRLRVDEGREADALKLIFGNAGTAGAVFHVYDRHRLDRAPRRYTVGPGGQLEDLWPAGAYDLWVLGPGGFHRHFIGDAATDQPALAIDPDGGDGGLSLTLTLTLALARGPARRVHIAANAYGLKSWDADLTPGVRAPDAKATGRWSLTASRGWYDLSVRLEGDDLYLRRLAGRVETGGPSLTDPAMGGPALMTRPV